MSNKTTPPPFRGFQSASPDGSAPTESPLPGSAVEVEITFACPHCKQSLTAPIEMAGQTVECPACKGGLSLPNPSLLRPTVEVALHPPPIPPQPSQGPSICPLCGSSKHMGKMLLLYDHRVCKECRTSFANRRALAYMLDVGMYLVVTLVFCCVASASAWPVFFLISPLAFCCKDCFSGQSLGKAICGVRVIDETSGKPAGIGASIKRNVLLFVTPLLFLAGFQLSRGHRIGDEWANAKVVWQKYASHPIFAPTVARPMELPLPGKQGNPLVWGVVGLIAGVVLSFWLLDLFDGLADWIYVLGMVAGGLAVGIPAFVSSKKRNGAAPAWLWKSWPKVYRSQLKERS